MFLQLNIPLRTLLLLLIGAALPRRGPMPRLLALSPLLGAAPGKLANFTLELP